MGVCRSQSQHIHTHWLICHQSIWTHVFGHWGIQRCPEELHTGRTRKFHTEVVRPQSLFAVRQQCCPPGHHVHDKYPWICQSEFTDVKKLQWLSKYVSCLCVHIWMRHESEECRFWIKRQQWDIVSGRIFAPPPHPLQVSCVTTNTGGSGRLHGFLPRVQTSSQMLHKSQRMHHILSQCRINSVWNVPCTVSQIQGSEDQKKGREKKKHTKVWRPRNYLKEMKSRGEWAQASLHAL